MFGCAARFGVIVACTCSRSARHVFDTGPGPDANRTCRRGCRAPSPAAAGSRARRRRTTIAATSTTSAPTSRRSSVAVAGAELGPVAGRRLKSRPRPEQVHRGDQHRARAAARPSRGSPCRTRSPRATTTVGRWTIAAATPDAISTLTDTNATFEKRGTQTASPAMRCAAGRLDQSTSSPIRPPTQIEPAARCDQSKKIDHARGDVCAACPASPGHEQHGARGEQRARRRRAAPRSSGAPARAGRPTARRAPRARRART